jgi:glutamine amidotransferase-like uncharacterized protein
LGALAALAACGAAPPRPDTRPVALVYRGPAACSGCAEAVAALLEHGPVSFRAVYCGPDEQVPLSASSLAGAAVYAQPGGGSVSPAWRRMRQHADEIRNWVRGGGSYLGFCLGAYLAGSTPGFGLLPGDTSQYVGSRGATVDTTDDTVVAVRWRGQPRHLFFQDGPYFKLNKDADATVLASYDNGLPAAVVTSFGSGRVGVVGPHPEADQSWYSAGLKNPDGIRPDLGYDLIQTTVGAPKPSPAG